MKNNSDAILHVDKSVDEALELIQANIDNSLGLGYLFNPGYSPKYFHGSVKANKFSIHKDYWFLRQLSPAFKGEVVSESSQTKIYISINDFGSQLSIVMFAIWTLILLNLGFGWFAIFPISLAALITFINVYIMKIAKEKSLDYLLKILNAKKIK